MRRFENGYKRSVYSSYPVGARLLRDIPAVPVYLCDSIRASGESKGDSEYQNKRGACVCSWLLRRGSRRSSACSVLHFIVFRSCDISGRIPCYYSDGSIVWLWKRWGFQAHSSPCCRNNNRRSSFPVIHRRFHQL